ECVELGNPVMESYPEQCRTEDGKTFTRDIGNELEKTDLIRIDNPRPGQTINSPLNITGEARGYWFFEASFPVELQDDNGNVIAQYYATAILDPNDPDSTWMTEEFVAFESTIEFEKPETKDGTLILRRDNPSGLEENDDELKVPIKF
ncbi:MAG: Gmad2 immunoglobulin-like domain-containing protein, partial [Candidatus Paceibacterota bacterium]